MRRKAQSFVEYCVLIGVIVMALIAMQSYIKRGIQGQMKGSFDQLAEGAYEPKGTSGITIVESEVYENSNSFSINGTYSDENNKTCNIDVRKSLSDSTYHTVNNRAEEVLAFDH